MKVAIIDDERDMRLSISQWLSLSGYEPESFASAEDALASINSNYPGVIISDIKMPGMDGIKLLKKLMVQDNQLPVILITGHGDVPMAVEAMRLGAFDFLEKRTFLSPSIRYPTLVASPLPSINDKFEM